VNASNVVVGIDVGGPNKGYHTVALCGTTVAGKLHSREPGEVAHWCSEQGATVVAVDAPCRWRAHGQQGRAAERALASDRISCFSTPTEARAAGHEFYTWMFAGQELYSALAPTFLLYTGAPRAGQVAIETFPQAVACALMGATVTANAKQKRAVRTGILQRAGVDTVGLLNTDEIDAALCAVAAQYFAAGEFKAYGDAAGGFIIVPHTPRAPMGALADAANRDGASRAALAQITALLPALTPAERQNLIAQLQRITV
jgi:predicted nuclease with RNAse H fold